MISNSDANANSPGRKFSWVPIAKLLVMAVVIYFIYRAVGKAKSEFGNRNFDIANIRWDWLLVASICYICGMIPMGLNWHRLLNAMQQPVPMTDAVVTHFISQLGKYVPGKACVPAIRFALLSKFKLHAPTAFVSMGAETLAMMSVGAFLGAGIVAMSSTASGSVKLIAAGLALLAGIPVMPPVLRMIVTILEKRRAKKAGEEPAHVARNLTWRVVLIGWLGIVPGWILLGLSMFATMRALNVPETQDLSLRELPWITASYAISVVAGFASMLPGGFGVRELVIRELVAPEYGATTGLLAGVLHRMVSLMSELVVSGILYFSRRRPPRQTPQD